MSAQTSYGAAAVAQDGQLVYGQRLGLYLSKACETVAGIDFGRVVSKGTTDDDCILGGTTPIGVAFFDHGQGNTYQSTGKYDRYSQVNVVDKDFVYMRTVSASGAYRAKVYYDTSTGLVVVTDDPSPTQRIIGYLGQTLTAAGLIKVYVDTDLFYQEADVASIAEEAAVDAVDSAIEEALEGYSTTTEMNAAMEDFVAPSPVTSASATVGNAQSVVAWTDPADADLSHIVVECMPTATGLVNARKVVAAAAETTTVTGLSNGTAYTFRIWAVDTDGNYSPVVTTTATPSA